MFTTIIRKYPLVISFVLTFFAIQIIPYALDTDKKDNITTKLMLGINYYPSKLVSNVKLTLSEFWDSYIYLVNLKEENNHLKQKIENLTIKDHTFEELKAQNKRLRNLLNYKEFSEKETISANVIGGSPSIVRSEFIMIDKGEKDGVTKGMPVSTNLGIVGRVHLASKRNSTVMLITDPISTVDAIVHRTRARGIVKGLGNKCIMKYIEKEDSITIGDKIISSGKDGIYPKGILIGKVTDIKDKGGLYEAIVESEVDTNTLEEILVIIK